ncbi:Late embryogenesis abundant protein [Musa troglodytarum]|uniref:Late embryogenesis abundant protein n=1 Tax=Musa troglodytarum TaxID=320322 RepID=A0A9E7K890_9LILI|nr:Late embryogenesis abundant protein [Musa troglodytarum]
MTRLADPIPVVTGYPTGAGYPNPYPYVYGAPPPQPPPHAVPYYPYGAGAAPPRSTVFVRSLCAVMIASFLVLFVFNLVLWLVLRPNLPEITVSWAAVSGFNLTAAAQQLSADFNVSLTFHNPNDKLGIDYDEIGVAVLYDSEIISYAPIPPFYQEKGSTTAAGARLVAVSEYLSSDAAKAMDWDRSHGDGALSFIFRVFARVKFGSGAWWTRGDAMRAHCKDVRIGFGNGTVAAAGALVGPSPKNCLVLM